jgi:hypothetical protein
MEGNIWSCKIGFAVDLPRAADWPMRKAVMEAFSAVAKLEPLFCLSGWGATLTEAEFAVVENRPPRPDAWATIRKQEQQELADLRAQLAAANAQRDELLRAAQKRVAYGHNDTCSTQLGCDIPVECSCGHDELSQAIARAQSGQPAQRDDDGTASGGGAQ